MTSNRRVLAHARPRRSGLAAGRVVLAAGWLGVMVAGAALGASAEPSAEPGPDQTNIEVWLDLPIPADLPIGESYALGATMWDTTSQTFAQFNQAYIRLHPAKGSAKPTVGKANSDWPGHLIGDVEVPKGGAGKLELGLSEKVCTIRGSVQTCDEQEFPFKMAGTGPPPDAPRSGLVVATVHEPPRSILAGQPIDLVVELEPQAAWDLDSLGLPDQLVAIVNERSGPDLAVAELHATGERGIRPMVTYSGQITIPAPGDMTLVVVIPGSGSEDQLIQGSTTRLTVGGEAVTRSARPGAAGPPAAPTGDEVPWVAIGLAALVVAGGLVIRKAFADL